MNPLLALAAMLAGTDSLVIRVNQVGYLPDAPKVAVACALSSSAVNQSAEFVVRDERGRIAQRSQTVRASGAFGPCAETWRFDFTRIGTPGSYTIESGATVSPRIRVAADVYRGGVDTALIYMREQRSGWNPFFKDSVHRRDGFVIDDTGRVVKFLPVSGGWADASDYLQYVATSATATYDLLLAYRDHRAAHKPAVLDEARHGLDWLLRMFPTDSEIYNQLGDDRDHTYLDLPTTDSSDYGWGKGKERPIYRCTGRPQGIFAFKNRSTGAASTAGKFASAFALAAQIYARPDPAFAAELRHRAQAAYAQGEKSPGVCQTAPGHAPYFDEEDNWVDDMELAAAELHALTRQESYLRDARSFAAREPVTPWMGADTARHYQWYPFINLGHFAIWRLSTAADRATASGYYRAGLERVVARASNGFRIGIPFIWCSNDLIVSFATQAILYRQMTGDARFREYEQAAIDWLFGANPWGTSMVVGYPNAGTWPHDPHSVVAMQFGPRSITGGLVDGPVYRSIYGNLRGIALRHDDAFAPFNTGFIVYHDDLGDYSTNEPIMDGTANLLHLLAALAPRN